MTRTYSEMNLRKDRPAKLTALLEAVSLEGTEAFTRECSNCLGLSGPSFASWDQTQRAAELE